MKICKRNHEYSENLRQCPECRQVSTKAYYETNKEKNKEKNRLNSKIYYEKNKEQYLLDKKVYYEANKDKCKASMKVWHEKNKEQVKAYDKVFYEKNKEQRKADMRAWQIANPSKVNATAAKRRAAKLQATPNWLSKEQLTEITEFYTLAQELAWLNQDGKPFHVDHIIPLQGENVSGLHVPWNLQLLLATDNLKKGNRI